MPSHLTLDQRLATDYPEWSADTRAKIVRFQRLLAAENEIQNLTRLVEDEAFIEGHVIDCVELLKSGLLEEPIADLGSGAGVPGLMCAILKPQKWVLVESEKRKADFLQRAVEELGLKNVHVVGERIEDYLRVGVVSSIVARAVGPVSRMWAWIGKCSTWNNLVLLKSRGWADEWSEFKKTPSGKRLEALPAHEYEVGEEKKYRVIVRLNRVR